MNSATVVDLTINSSDLCLKCFTNWTVGKNENKTNYFQERTQTIFFKTTPHGIYSYQFFLSHETCMLEAKDY